MAKNPVEGRSADSARAQRFERLYQEHHPQVFGYVMRRCDSSDDAADAIAETFLVAWRRLDDAPTGDPLRLWLYGVARRVMANQRRGARRRLALSDRLRWDLATASITAQPGATGAMDPPAHLRRAFMSLSANDREVLALEAWEQLSGEQIAKVLGCSSAAARTRLHRARHRLRTAMDHAEAGTSQARLNHDSDRPQPIEGSI